MTVPHIEPMLASAGDLPTGDGWAFEPKWDGMRVLAEIDGGAVRLRSRTGRDVTVEFPELGLLGAVAPRAVLDGEVVAFDASGRPSFQELQPRFGVTDAGEARSRAGIAPVTYVVFDLLHLDGLDAWQLPFDHRRRLLVDLVGDDASVSVTPSHVGDAQHWLDAARERGLEGIMAKRLDRPYEPGRRSSAWRKVKLRHAQEFAVCGWVPGKDGRSGWVGSLVLGCRGAEGWRWVGNAGSGLSAADVRWWTAELAPWETSVSPFAPAPRHVALRSARWVEPRHVVQVAFAEWTGGHRLRAPAILGRRPDVDVATVSCSEEPVVGERPTELGR